MSALRVMLYVQHLLGIGHLARMSHIATALKRHGLDPVLVTGGVPAPGFPPAGITHVALPPLKSSDGFRALLTGDGAAASPAFLKARRDRLVSLLHSTKPQLILIEAFPFGRRQMRFELLALLEAARAMQPKPIIAASVRDIVQPLTKTGREAEVLRTLKLYFDHVLVHGDPRLVRLADSFPAEARIAPPVSYTGLVTGGDIAPAPERFDVIVSAGGGAAQGRLCQTALEARALTPLAARRWLVITGPNAPDGLTATLMSKLQDGDAVVPFRSDFLGLLAQAQLSISQAGYNTCGDLLRTGCPAVLVPFAAGGEREQTLRAGRLAERGLAVTVDEASLDARRLAEAIGRAVAGGRRSAAGIDLDGADRTAGLIKKAVGIRQ
ncbi:MAG TPA: glycosyltransferase [Aestuariivirgaceae bacterium]|nr:glycosyltransferase [Aestuariivirgaceae bacterium]